MRCVTSVISFHAIAPYSIQCPIHLYLPGGSSMQWLAGILAGATHAPCGLPRPSSEGAMFLRQARAGEGLELKRLGCACCLGSQLSGVQGTRPWAPM
jgi:hypothetical protein